MKKLFALALIAGSLSFFACEDNDTNVHDDGTDTTKVENTTIENTTVVDDTSTTKTGDTTIVK